MRASSDAKYRPEIDGLRALAVGAVILFHSGASVLGGGFLGVDVFFVISGYLIAGIVHSEILRGEFSIFKFYERRIRRIFPALYLVIAVSLPFGWAWLFPTELADFGRSLIAVSLFLSNAFFNKEINYFKPDVGAIPLIHTWSLAVEEQFYVGFPMLLLLIARWPRKLAIGILVAIALASLAIAQWASRADPQADFYLLPTRAWELGVGAILALVPRSGATRAALTEQTAAVLGLALIFVALFGFNSTMPLPGLWTLVPVIGTALTLRYATGSTLAGRALAAKPLVLAGLASYSAYLWHQPILAFARFRFDIQPSLFIIAAVFVAAFALAYLSWRFVEQPFRDRAKVSRRSVFAFAVVAVVATLVAGRLAAVYRGFPSRMPPIEGLADARDKSSLLFKCSDVPDLSDAALDALTDCRLGVAGKAPEFLLTGDSHAGSLAYGVSDAALAADRAGLLLASNACLPIIGLDGLYSRSEDACEKLHDNLVAIVRHFRIKLVVLHARWENLGQKGPLAQFEAVKKRLVEMLDRLTAEGARVVIVGSTPGSAYRVPEILARKTRYGLQVEERSPFSDFREQNAFAAQLFADEEVRRRARIVELYPFFCGDPPKPFCEVADGERPYFFDETHLTHFGARRLAPILSQVFF